MTWLRGFSRFWYDFIVGDDWTIAVAAVLAVAITAVLSHQGRNAWAVLPICVLGALAASLWRALQVHRRLTNPESSRNRRDGER